MKIAVAMLQQWYRDNPARLLQAALSQAERLAQMAPEAEAIRAQNASLQQQLEVKTKRIAQLEAALEEAQRAAHRQAALSVATPKDAPLRPSDRGASADIRALAAEPEQIDESLEVKLCSCPHCGGTQFKDHHAIDLMRSGRHVARRRRTPKAES